MAATSTGKTTAIGENWTTLWNPNSGDDTVYATTIGVWVTSGDVAYVHVSNLHGAADEGYKLKENRVEYFTMYPRGVGLIKARTDDAALTADVHWSIVTRKTD